MVQAYRLLVSHMIGEGMDYPLHLGVTEAGDGEDGRIKSAVGIGTLLEDGLGDTIRVSLTEEPEAEIPVARILAERYSSRISHQPIAEENYPIDPFSYSRRKSKHILNFGEREVPRVIANLSNREKISAASLYPLGYNYSVPLDKWNLSDMACDYIYIDKNHIDFEIPGTLGVLYDFESRSENESKERHFALLNADEYRSDNFNSHLIHFIKCKISDINPEMISKLKSDSKAILVLSSDNLHAMPEMRAAIFRLMNAECVIPVVIQSSYDDLNLDAFQLYSATDTGALLIDGLGDGIMIFCDKIPLKEINSTAFGILQATRTRISRTEYISCPSCGRTLFDLQETTARIRKRTDHLKGIKIGIMGCIVNGPGEMADADYGYVGTGPGKITLYKEKDVVKRNVPADNAVDELIELIKEYGDWVEPGLGLIEIS